jgi:N-ethylmaleimide reductase
MRFRREHPQGAWIVNNGYTRAMAAEALRSGTADLVAFGRPYISNPDPVDRLRLNRPIVPLRESLLHGGGAPGYTDYPSLPGLRRRSPDEAAAPLSRLG